MNLTLAATGAEKAARASRAESARDYEPDTAMGGTGKDHFYDPSNGTVSSGDLYRFGP